MNKIYQFPTSKDNQTYQARPNVAGETTAEDIQEAIKIDFRKEWQRGLPFLKRTGLTERQVLQHDVILTDVMMAIARAQPLKNDQDAVDYFENLQTNMLAEKNYAVKLAEIPESLRGYVWSLNYHYLTRSEAYIRYQLGCIIGKPIIRHTFF